MTGSALVVVVADRLPTRRLGLDGRVLQLLHDLRSAAPQARIQLLVLEGEVGGHAGLAMLGVESEAVGAGAAQWLAERRFTIALLIAAGRSAARLLPDVISATQPQAVVALDLAFAFSAGTPDRAEPPLPGDSSGVQFMTTDGWARARVRFSACDVLLSPDVVTLQAVAGGAPHPATVHYPTRVPARPGLPVVGRSGIAFAGVFGAAPDPDEDALRFAVEGVLPAVGAPAATTLVTDVVYPWMARSVGRVAPGIELDSVLAASRVLLVTRRFGGPPSWLLAEADAAGIPVVGTPWASDGHPRPGLVASDPRELAALCRSALVDDEIAATFVAPADETDHLSAVAELLSLAGIESVPSPTDRLEEARARTGWIAVAPGTASQTAGLAEHRPPRRHLVPPRVVPEDRWPATSYGWWVAAHPLDSAAVDRLERALSGLADRPLISILMPVWNTDPSILGEAVASVRSQLYRNWELCIVDDHSSRPETVEALAALEGADPRIGIRRLEENLGIGRASQAALEAATGEFVGLLDHDDVLSPDALAEVALLLDRRPELDFVYSDEDKLDPEGQRVSPFFKPSWSPELHLCVNYVTHFAIYRRSLLEEVGGFRGGYDGSQDYDLSLRASERARAIGHIAKPLYSWRMVSGSAAVAHDAKPYAIDAARRALESAVERRGEEAVVTPGLIPGTWRVRRIVRERPLVSILIPTRDRSELLARCIASVEKLSTYREFEFVIIDNGSTEPETRRFLATVKARVIEYPFAFNYARQMNLAAQSAAGDLLLFLNNDVEVLEPTWLEAMIEFAVRADVGAVGARLLFPDGRVQHEGVFVGYGGGCAGNIDFGGYFSLGAMVRDVTAVTAACMMTRPEVFAAVGGFDERLRVAFNDVDLCLRMGALGYRIVYTPYSQLAHAESASRGALHPEDDERRFRSRWGNPADLRDRFYNPNLDPVQPFRLVVGNIEP